MSENLLFEMSSERKRYHSALKLPRKLIWSWLTLTILAITLAFVGPEDWARQGAALTSHLHSRFLAMCDVDAGQIRLMMARMLAALALALASLWPLTGLVLAWRRPVNPEGVALGYTPLRLAIFTAFPPMAIAVMLMPETVRGSPLGCAAFRDPFQFALHFTAGLIAVLVSWFYRAAVLGDRK